MAWSVLQSASGTATGTTASATYGTNLSSGTKLVVLVATDDTGGNTGNFTSVKDGAGNTFTQLKAIGGTTGGGVTVALYALDTPAGDVGTKPTITITYAISVGMSILVQEVSGLLAGNTTAMLDGAAAAVQETPTTSQAQPAYSSTAANEYLVSCLGDNGNSVTWALSGYTLDANSVQGNATADDIIGYKNSTNGAESGTWTTSGTPTGSGLIVVAFKLAAVSAGPAGQRQPWATVPVPRRRPARAIWHGISSNGPVFVPAPRQQPGPAPRRKLARAVVQFTPVRTTNAAAAQVPGQVQPRATVPVPRRRPARGLWGGLHSNGPVFVPAPHQPPYLPPRRRPARAYVQFTPVRTTNATGAPPPNGTIQPRATVPVPRRQPRQRAYVQFTPVRTTNTPPFHPPSGVVFGGQSSGGDRDHDVRVFRSIMPGEIPASGSALPKLQGRGYAAPPPERADDLEHLWETPAQPAEPPGPTPAEIVLGEAHRAAGALYDLGRILAPEPYVAPSKATCGALRKIGTETLKCKRKRGHGGMHSDRGVRWG